MNSKRLAFVVFGLLGVLALLTWYYERGSAPGTCNFRGGLIPGAGGQHAGSMQEMHMGGYGFRGFGLAFWVLVAAFIYLLFDTKKKSSAVEELNARLARGEITRQEYLKAKRLLEER